MKVFLAMPYTQLCNEDNVVKKEYKDFFEKLITELENMNCDYFLAHKRENWGKEYTSDTESTQIDYDTIRSADLVCVIPGIPYSGGVHVEIGWASSAKRKLRIFLKEKCSYSPMVTGIKCLTDTEYFYYKEDFGQDLLNLILDCIKKEMEK